MNYTKLGTAQKREILTNNLTQIESQHFARSLDAAHWRDVQDDPLTDAIKADDRIANNRAEESKQQLAGALYDLAKLELKAKQLRDELAALAKDPKALPLKSGDA